jgi:hypothetical protein
MSNTSGIVDKTKNVYDSTIKKSSKKCFGCNLNPVNRWCSYRNWRHEGKSGYSFRAFQKIHLLPTCSRPDFKYAEREEFKQAYCDTLGVTYQDLFPNHGKLRGGGRGGRAKKKMKLLTA